MKLSRISTFAFLSLLAMSTLSIHSCKSKKKITAPTTNKTEVKENVSTANVGLVKNQLRKLLTDSNLSVDDLEQQLAELKAKNIQDDEVQSLINQVEEKIKQKKGELKASEEKARAMSTTQEAVVGSFKSIAQSADYDTANDIISGALSKFESPDVPVLIIIAEEGGKKDYDKPTTIGKYLEYIKMQKKFEPKVEEIVRNAAGKITRLVLRK